MEGSGKRVMNRLGEYLQFDTSSPFDTNQPIQITLAELASPL